MEEAYTWIKNIVIYMLLNTIIMNLLGNKSYKKYVSIVSGMILVLIVISPLMKLMKLDEIWIIISGPMILPSKPQSFKKDLSRIEEEQEPRYLPSM